MSLPRNPFAYASSTACCSRSAPRRELAADVDERVVRLDRVRRDRPTPSMIWCGIALDEHVVLERGRLTLVGVDGEVAREHVLREERPLLAGAEARAAATAQARGRHLLDDLRGLHPERLLEHRVRLVVRARGVEGPGVVRPVAEELRDDARLLGRPVRRSQRSLRPWHSRSARTIGLRGAASAACGVVRARPSVASRRTLARVGVGSVELVVDLEHRRDVARGEALDLFDVHVASSAKRAREVLEQLGATVHEARHVRAHRHDEAADRLALEHRVEGARPEHERRRELERARRSPPSRRASPSRPVLREVQRAAASPTSRAGTRATISLARRRSDPVPCSVASTGIVTGRPRP